MGQKKDDLRNDIHAEIEDMKQELEHFQLEKERVRTIVGEIGGVPTFHAKLMNILFAIMIAVSLVISLMMGDKWRLLMIEFATVALAVKIIYMMHCQMKVNHFKLWVLSSLEWRINEMMKILRKMED